jgi:polysaccharide pyruvyl transferase WcaK-like protein
LFFKARAKVELLIIEHKMNLLLQIANKIKSKYYRHKKSFPRLVKYIPNGDLRLCHISAFSYRNAGDVVLPVVLRDLFNQKLGVGQWDGIHVHNAIDDNRLSLINCSNAMVIGGGGLFLKDTNPNNISGWQWPCSIDYLKKINVPILMFAVGYNRFRGQEEFDPIFRENLNEFVRKAAFIGIRNHGSIEKLKGYLDSSELKDKLTYQPCMTTLISKIYPELTDYNTKEDFIAVNCAFDRENLRFYSQEVLKSIARVVKKMSGITTIKYYSHVRSDKKILSYFDDLNIPYELIELYSPKSVINAYSKPRLVIGMRGHAQLIPFGCKTPIISIISHDKMKWFLEDIDHPNWGVDVVNPDFENQLLEKANDFYTNYQASISEISVQQEKLWGVTQNNMKRICEIVHQKN